MKGKVTSGCAAVAGPDPASIVFQHTEEGILVTDELGRIVAANPAASRITGYERGELIGAPMSLLSAGAKRTGFEELVLCALRIFGSWEGELWRRRKDGRLYPQRTRVTLVPDRGCYLVEFNEAGTITEGTPSVASCFDPLTRLPGRALFIDRLCHAVARVDSRDGTLGLILIHLEGVGTLRDVPRHEHYASLLQVVGMRLRESVARADTAASLGDDRFAVLLEAARAPSEAEEVAEEIVAILGVGVELDGCEYRLNASMGLALYPDDARATEELIGRADAALREAELRGGRTCRRASLPGVPEWRPDRYS